MRVHCSNKVTLEESWRNLDISFKKISPDIDISFYLDKSSLEAKLCDKSEPSIFLNQWSRLLYSSDFHHCRRAGSTIFTFEFKGYNSIDEIILATMKSNLQTWIEVPLFKIYIQFFKKKDCPFRGANRWTFSWNLVEMMIISTSNT